MEQKKSFYITTPIYYPSANLHIGHSYTTVAADAMARYKRLRGYDVMFLTGTDEHGQKIQDRALAAGKNPQEFVDEIVAGIKVLWSTLDISYDRFIRTTDDYHKRAVEYIFQRLYDKGDIYLSEYEGWYCKDCESFWTDSQLDKECCPDCKREVKMTKESSYFFRMSKYQDALIKLLEENPDFVQPPSRANEMLNNFLRPGLEDLAVSRTSFDWGVKVPFDPKHVVYVWIDALVNYITAMGYPDTEGDFARFWPADVQLVGKEIVRFHTLIWPAILMALDIPLPKKVFGHGWLLFKGGKMSKSMGNVVDPLVLCERYGVDAIRYFLLREVPFGADGAFSNEALVQRINSDLANDLGNLVSRSTAMVQKYFDGVLPSERQAEPADDELLQEFARLFLKVEESMEKLEFNIALADIWRAVAKANKYIDICMPWVLAKDEAQKARLATVLYNLLESLRVVAILIQPFMPHTSESIFRALKMEPTAELMDWDEAKVWGLLASDEAITAVAPIFPRLDINKEIDAMNALLEAQGLVPAAGAEAESAADAAEQTAKTDKKPKAEKQVASADVKVGVASYLDFADFEKVKLIAAVVKDCRRVEGADRLLCSQLDIGCEDLRQVVSGIAEYYTPEEVIGKTVILVENLAPRKIRGAQSQGMLLCATDQNGAYKLLTVDGAVAPGSVVG